MNLALAATIALIPGIVSWWLGRRLLRFMDSPALAELWWRTRQRQIRLAAVCLVLAMMAAPSQGWWLIPLLGITALAGAFPARRTVLEEQWGFGGYLGWLARLLTVLGSFWILIIVGPSLVAWAGPDRPWAPVVLLSMLLIRLFLPQRWVLALLGTTPMEAEEIDRLPLFLNHLAGASSAPPAGLFRLDMRGGRWVNALAVPHPTKPAVVFSQPLLELLTPGEVAAVLAHETAHLEHFNPGRLRRQALGAVILAIVASALVPLSRLLVGETLWVPVGWMVFLVLLFGQKVARNRVHEADSDRRALELCGDAETLISALGILHEANRVPRRLSRKDEDRSTHPSLANRIQAIRTAAADVPHDASGSTGAGEPGPTSILACSRKGEWVILDEDRITWLTGVPESIDPERDPGDLGSAATSSLSLAYQGIAELRIRVRRGRTADLLAVTTAGEKTIVPLAPEAVAKAQRALDAVDSKLAVTPDQNFLSRTAGATRAVRLVAALAGVMGFALLAAGAVLVSSLLALARPRATWLIAAGVGCLAGAATSLPRITGSGDLVRFQWAAIGVVTLAGFYFLIVGIAKVVDAPEQHGPDAWIPALLLGVTLAAVWAGVIAFALLNGDGVLDPYWLRRAVRWAPSLVAYPLSLAAILAVMRRRRANWLLGITIVLAVLALLIRSGVFRSEFVTDPLLPRSQPPDVAAVETEQIFKLDLENGGFLIRLSPDGSHAAVGRATESTGDLGSDSAALEWVVWRLEPSNPHKVATIEALDLALLNDAQALALAVETPPPSDLQSAPSQSLRLSRIDTAGPADRNWSVVVTGVFQPELRVDSAVARWRVSGQSHRFGGSWDLLVAEGHLGSSQFSQRRLSLEGEFPSDWIMLESDTALAVTTWYDERFAATPLMWMVPRPRFNLVLLDRGTRTDLARTRLQLSCAELGQGQALCAAGDPETTTLWRVASDVGGGTPYEPIASVPGSGFLMAQPFDGGALLWSPQRDDLIVLESCSREPRRLVLADEGWRIAVAASRSGVLAEIRYSETGTILVVNRPRTPQKSDELS